MASSLQLVFISDHRGICIQFKAGYIFDMATVDTSHASYMRLRMGKRDIVKQYITRIETIYKEHHIWTRVEELDQNTLKATTDNIKDKCFQKFDKLD